MQSRGNITFPACNWLSYDSLDRRILSIDGCGLRGLTQLTLLQRIMHQMGQPERPPAEVFDLICGTAAGGLIAILLGRLGMNCEMAINTFTNLERSLFTRPGTQPTSGVWNEGDLLTNAGNFGTQAFRDALTTVITDILGSNPVFDSSDNANVRQCRVGTTCHRLTPMPVSHPKHRPSSLWFRERMPEETMMLLGFARTEPRRSTLHRPLVIIGLCGTQQSERQHARACFHL